MRAIELWSSFGTSKSAVDSVFGGAGAEHLSLKHGCQMLKGLIIGGRLHFAVGVLASMSLESVR